MQSIPTDLIIEILSRLPEKSVARFSCVSKLWTSITSDPSFPRPRLLLCFQKHDDLFVSSIPQHTQKNSNCSSYSSSLSFYHHHHKTKLPVNFLHCTCTESVHGLICFELKKPIVWNPSTRSFIRLPAIPEPCKDWKKSTLLLGYDPVEGKHKVVCVPYKRNCYVCRVFTLGSSKESWRTVRANRQHRPASDAHGRCIEGVIYYIANYGKVVMSFDVRSEKFDMIKLPTRYCQDLITYKGRLACFDHWDRRRFWILEDAQKHIWLGQDFLSSLVDRSFKLTGFTHAGEFIYVPERDRQLFYILLCDPVRNSWRRLEFKISTVHNEEEQEPGTYALHAFPNHIDSQMSL
ncbi:hypothetical protein Bca4012_069122 [Brassica carinata]